MPKLYFYDTGLALALLGIEHQSQLSFHPFRGSIFENLIVLEFLKRKYNNGIRDNLYFWRNNVGNEIDLIIEKTNKRIPIEIKSGQTITSDYFKGINYWTKITNSKGGFVIYDGKEIQNRSNDIKVLPVSNIDIALEYQDK